MKKQIVLVAMILAMTGLGLHGQSIVVNSPAGGGNLFAGQDVTITWGKSGVMQETVAIRLRAAGSLESDPPAIVIADNETNDGSFVWKIPASVPQGRYFIRVRTDDATVIGDGRPFNIIAVPPIQQNAPANPQPQGIPQTNIGQSPAFANKPDFEIVDIERLTGGVFWAKLHNKGKAGYNGPLSFHVDFGTAADGLVTVPVNVAAGATQSVSLEYYLRNEDLGARSCVLVKVLANSDKKVAEINENNNEKSRLFSNVRKIEISVTPQESHGPYPLPVSMTIKIDVFAAGEVWVKSFETNNSTGVKKYVIPASGSHEFKEDLIPIREEWLATPPDGNPCYKQGWFCTTLKAWVEGCEPDGHKIESNRVKCTYYKPQ